MTVKNVFHPSAWINIKPINSRAYICWNCGGDISSNYGYESNRSEKQSIYICHHCNAPTVFDFYGNNTIGVFPGKNIKGLPEEIEEIYNEARACISVGAYTGAVMLFRKILMNFAVKEGAEENNNFLYYVNYLCDNGSVHKKHIKQADNVRKISNEANHELENRTEEEAMEHFKFIEFLLLNNYEFADEKETVKVT